MIFREMRRKKQALSETEIMKILHRGISGVLALAGDNGYPYAVPVSYVYDEGKLYFHSAETGYKIDAIKRNKKASFCVTEDSDANRSRVIRNAWEAFCMLEMTIEHVTGKAARELISNDL